MHFGVKSALSYSAAKHIYFYTGWPRKNGTVDTVDFQDFALINSYFLHFVG